MSAIEAIKENKPLLAKSLIEKDPRLALAKDNDGRTAFHWACSANNSELVKFLAQYDVDIDEMEDDSGWNPLHIAASLGNVTAVTSLMNMKQKPDVNARTMAGTTALHLAVSRGHADAVTLLVTCGARVSDTDKRGQNALHRAASIGSVPMLLALKKANLNARDKDGWTALHHALAEGHAEFAAKMVEMGADASITNNDGLEPYQVSVDDKTAQSFRQAIGK